MNSRASVVQKVVKLLIAAGSLEADEFLTVKGAADYLGISPRVAMAYLDTLVAEGLLIKTQDKFTGMNGRPGNRYFMR